MVPVIMDLGLLQLTEQSMEAEAKIDSALRSGIKQMVMK